MENNSKLLDFADLQTNYRELQNECRKKKEFIDVQLQVGDKLFDAHRVVLSLYSPVLKAMISDQWSTTKVCPISEEYVDPEIVEDLMGFFYTGKIELTADNVHPICMAAHYLQISNLLDYTVNYLCQLITVDNVLTLFQFSVLCDLERFRYCCLLIIKGRESVLQSSQILEFSFEDFNNLIVGLKDAFADPVLRERSFHCIVRWTENNCSERLEHLPILLKNIPLDELSSDFLTNTVSNHPIVKESNSCAKTVSTTLANFQIYQKAQLKQNFIVISNLKWGIESMNCYDSRTGVWRRLPDRQFHRNCFAVTVINRQKIIFTGGYVNGEYRTTTDSVEMFDWNEQTWTKLPKMPVALERPSIAAHDGNLYMAGQQEEASISTILCYSFKTKQWKAIWRLNYEIRHLISTDDHLYAFNCSGKVVDKFDPAQNQWTRMAARLNQLPNVGDCAVTLHQKKIYVCEYDGFHMIDPETNIWTELPSPKNLCNTSLMSLNDKLLVVGGYPKGVSPIQYSDLIQEFDFSTQEWRDFGKFPLTRTQLFTVVGNFY